MVLAEAISMTHSALLYQPDISTFFLGAVAVSAFCPLGIYINLGLVFYHFDSQEPRRQPFLEMFLFASNIFTL